MEHARWLPARGVPVAAILVDALVLGLLLRQGHAWHAAHLAAFGAGFVAYGVIARWGLRGVGSSLPAALLVLALRGGLLGTLERLGVGSPAGIVLAAVLAWPLLFAVLRVLDSTRAPDGWRNEDSVVKRLILFVALTFALRLLYLLPVELMHEEAYYWLYAWHLDYGYLDHPPFVGWMIRLGTAIAGDTELGVRLLSPLFALGTAAFVFALTMRIFDRARAWLAVALLGVLPFLFCTGIIAFPDTPLVFCWAGTAYFLHRELVDRAPKAWLGVGVFLGLGLLAKYTIALLGLSGILFAVMDPKSRQLLKTWRPYAAVAVALLVFSPVLVWNAQHEWISFARQSTDRLTGNPHFQLHVLLLFAAVNLTPLGLLGGGATLRTWWQGRSQPVADRAEPAWRSLCLALTLIVVPAVVVVLASLARNTKFNWTAPMWIPLLPWIARWMLDRRVREGGTPLYKAGRTAARYAVASLLLYALGLYYLGVGVPGVPYPKGTGVGWRGLGARIEAMAESKRRPDGSRPLVVGLDGDTTPSWIAFYRCMAAKEGRCGAAVEETIGRHGFGERCGMFEYWYPLGREEHDELLVVSVRADPLEEHWVTDRIQGADPVLEIPLSKNGHPAGSYFVRWVHDYAGP